MRIEQAEDRQQHPVSSAVLRLARERLLDDATAEVHRRQRDSLAAASRSAKRRRLVLPLALAASCALTVFVYRSQRGDLRQITHLAHVATSEQGAYWTFSDGSTVDLTPDARLAVTGAGADGAELTLEDGTASLNIIARTPSRPARWSVRAGAYAIQVRGTRFTVSWHALRAQLDVRLDEGSVLVVGPRLGAGVTLEPGQRLTVDQAEVRHTMATVAPATGDRAAALEPATESAPPAAPGPPPAPATTREPRTTAPPPQADTTRLAGSWSALVEAGQLEEVVRAAEGSGLTHCLAHCSEKELRALADAARLGGRAGLAEQALFAMRRRFADTLSGRTATFLIARLYEEAHNDPARALVWFDRYLAEAPDDAYAADALGRKMMLLRRGGDEVSARQAASEYLRRFPGGPYAAPARQLNATR